jgi:hypothetical protein
MKTSHLFFIGVGLCALASLGQVNEGTQISRKLDARADASSLVDREDTQSAKSRRRRSKVALQRVQAGCIPVAGPNGDLPITEDSPIGSPEGSALAVGDIVCNARGETAVVDLDESDATIAAKVAATSPNDLAKYRKSFDLILSNLKKPSQQPKLDKQQDLT